MCYQSRRMFPHQSLRFVLLVDSADACKHVFQILDPTEARRSDLWPAISLARNLVSRLRQHDIQVCAEQVVSRKNLAHHIAKSEMRYRRDRGWRPHEDRWPEALPCVFREVWHDVARSRSGESMDTGTRLLSKGSGRNKMPKVDELSDDVLRALDCIARGVA